MAASKTFFTEICITEVLKITVNILVVGFQWCPAVGMFPEKTVVAKKSVNRI